MLKGRMELRLDGERRLLNAGDILIVPGGVEHEAWSREDTEVVDVFAQDFLVGGAPAYIREIKR